MSDLIPVVTHTPQSGITLAAWVPNYEAGFASLADWLVMFQGVVASAAKEKTEILLLPEYVSESWMVFCPPDRLKPTSDAWQAEQAELALAEIQKLATGHNMVIVVGTIIMKAEDGSWRNRSVVFFPDGTREVQDKISMMPDERESFGLKSGHSIRLFRYKGYCFAVIICLDIQIPRITASLIEQKVPDLILVPSMTTHLTGYNRVFTCAAARAVEMHCPVLVTGGVGTVTARGENETNTSGAGLFLPHDISLMQDGRMPGIGPFTRLERLEGLLHVVQNVPLALCRAQREQGTCEAWHYPNHLLQVEVCA